MGASTGETKDRLGGEPRRVISGLRLAAPVVLVALIVACAPTPGAVSQPPPNRPPAAVPKPVVSNCPNPSHSAAAYGGSDVATRGLDQQGLGPDATRVSLTSDEAYRRAFEAADTALTEQLSTGAGSPGPLAVTTLDAQGRPAVTRVVEADVYAATAAAVGTVREALNSGSSIVDVEPDRTVTATDVVRTNLGDPLRTRQWALDQFPFETAAAKVRGEEGIVVAVLDSGIDTSHEDLACAVVASHATTRESISAVGSHATHVAGIIAARADNGIGITGATPDVRLLNVKVLNQDGEGDMGDVANGIIWAVDNGADVINLSLAGPSPIAAMTTAIDYAEANGVVVVAAAGNDGTYQSSEDAAGSYYSWPAADPRAIAVASLDESGEVSAFSTRAPYVDVSAPGGLIISTRDANINGTLVRNAYVYMSGTSMATPYVSALVALTMASRPHDTPSQIRQRIESTATDLGPVGFDNASGWGRINLAPLIGTVG